jgi:hypothetical protein
MPPSPLPADQLAQAQALAQAIQQATAAEIEQLARNLVATDDQQLFGANEFKIRDLAHKIAAKAIATHLAQKKTVTKAPA